MYISLKFALVLSPLEIKKCAQGVEIEEFLHMSGL
jgi:hypothetical protein